METPPKWIGFECGFSSFHEPLLTHKVYVYGWNEGIQKSQSNIEIDVKEMIEYVFAQLGLVKTLISNPSHASQLCVCVH